MTRIVDQTYMNRMGFGDPDKRNPLHSAACQYLMESSVIAKLRQRFVPSTLEDEDGKNPNQIHRFERRLLEGQNGAERERPILRGARGTNSPVGSVDVVIPLVYEEEYSIVDTEVGKASSKYKKEISRPLLIEVKAGNVPVDEILRQLKWYRQLIHEGRTRRDYSNCSLYDHISIAATCYKPGPDESKALMEAGIWHVYLGDSFQQWWDRQRSRVSAEKQKLFEV